MNDERPIITWTPEMLERFRAAYAVANINRADSFRFDGHEFVRDYAKYLIEYLDGQFAERWRINTGEWPR